ncbi:hypothetical protein PR202_gb23263 [Eleusine coracana subsp. coracana]|uniref:C2 NT-type domain-containing protein n=1 Tax=Eleusine coracana subsp. coracana TaxID=191504 RepID=A0AAV5FHS0_ELECO|nr:hypothetical protein PR202_gb23263 [Eleusine coracana subsp. coracana]
MAQSNDQILHELDALSHTLYQSHTSKRRTTSLALPRQTGGDAATNATIQAAAARPPSRRMSMSPFRSRPTKLDKIDDDDDDDGLGSATPSKSQSFNGVGTVPSVAGEKKGIRSWRPIRALSRIGMQRVGCLFSVEVASAQGLPASMNGLRLVVAARKKDSRDGAVRTMPARVQHGEAHFEETLFVRCNLFCSGGGGGSKPLRFEPRPFLVYAVAVDAPGLDLGRSAVDLGLLVKESTDKAQHGERVRQWDMAFPLAGKAKGGELLVKLAFQIMEDGGVGLYSQQPAKGTTTSSSSSSSSMFARKQTKSSFSIQSPKLTTRSESSSSSSLAAAMVAQSPILKGIDDFKLDESGHVAPNLQGMGDFKLDEPTSPVVAEAPKQQEQQKELEEEEAKADDLEFPEFEVVDQGVEEQQQPTKEQPKEEVVTTENKEQEKAEEVSSSAAGDEVVKEMVLDSAKTWRMNELEAITNQIKALESMMLGDVSTDDAAAKPADEPLLLEENDGVGLLDADEDEVTREFLKLLEQGDGIDDDASSNSNKQWAPHSSLKSGANNKKPGGSSAAACYISDLGKNLGPIVQTRDGGYLAAMNPFDVPVAKKELPKLAMHLSKPFILRDQRLPSGGAEVFQCLCTAGAGGSEALMSKLGALVAMDDVAGKTAEQIAFEGMASAIISARSSNDLMASSSAAHSVSVLRTMAAAMSSGREDRIATGIWNAHDAPVAVDEVLAVSLQKIEAMAVEALRVQADMAEDKAPFVVSAEGDGHVLDAAVPMEEWASACAGVDAVNVLVVVQLRDPLRRYEAVGAPSIVIIQAARASGGAGDDEEPRFKVANMHLGGLRLMKSADRRNVWDGEKQRLTAMHWLVAYGLGKAGGGRKSRAVAAAAAKAGHEVLWSMSSRVMADMWLKPIRNPDVKLTK